MQKDVKPENRQPKHRLWAAERGKMLTGIKMWTAEYRVQKHTFDISILSIIYSLYGVIHIGMPLLSSTYGGHCVTSLFNMVACYSLRVYFGKWCF